MQDLQIADIAKLYYRYQTHSDEQIAYYLDKVTFVKKKKGKYRKLKKKWIEGIKHKPRKMSINFASDNISKNKVVGLEVVDTIYYLVKSSSRFFLKADVGEIFDAMGYDFQWPEFDYIEVDCDYYETLPNTDGEHHLMRVNLLKNGQR